MEIQNILCRKSASQGCSWSLS